MVGEPSRLGSEVGLTDDERALAITWLKDDSPEDQDGLPEPAALIAEIHDEMKANLRQIADMAAGLGVDLSEESADLV